MPVTINDALAGVTVVGVDTDAVLGAVYRAFNVPLGNAPELAWSGGGDLDLAYPAEAGPVATYVLTNRGRGPSGNLSGTIALSGAAPDRFEITADSCARPLGIGQSCAVSVRARAALFAGCDVVLHCNGDMDEMKDVAGEAKTLEGLPLRRAQHALGRLVVPPAFDTHAATARLSELLEGAAA